MKINVKKNRSPRIFLHTVCSATKIEVRFNISCSYKLYITSIDMLSLARYYVLSSNVNKIIKTFDINLIFSESYTIWLTFREIDACFYFRVWGVSCGASPSPYASWRDMYIDRPRLMFNGCYISKTTYFRHGENSFQDQYYRPWHLVQYYRYLR